MNTRRVINAAEHAIYAYWICLIGQWLEENPIHTACVALSFIIALNSRLD